MYHAAKEIFESRLTVHQLLYFKTRDELIEALPSFVKQEDTILVKASHFMGFNEIVKALLS
jgi:UDP-N-acetylmuramoyl-tripeptide--D-alanyl-D-alanine ligase